MKQVEIRDATGSLAKYTEEIHGETLVVTVEGRPAAALVPLENTDMETAALSTNPQFIALIERSRTRQTDEGGVESADIRRRLGH